MDTLDLGCIKGPYSSRDQLLKKSNQFSKNNLGWTIQEKQFKKTNSRKTILEEQFKKNNSWRIIQRSSSERKTLVNITLGRTIILPFTDVDACQLASN
jgi:hypothetical protein